MLIMQNHGLESPLSIHASARDSTSSAGRSKVSNQWGRPFPWSWGESLARKA